MSLCRVPWKSSVYLMVVVGFSVGPLYLTRINPRPLPLGSQSSEDALWQKVFAFFEEASVPFLQS